jgi:hypothetical protein
MVFRLFGIAAKIFLGTVMMLGVEKWNNRAMKIVSLYRHIVTLLLSQKVVERIHFLSSIECV